MLVLIIILVLLALAVLLFILARLLQGLFYTESVADLYWRAPAAAAAIVFVAFVWPVIFNSMSKPSEGGLRWPISFNDVFLDVEVGKQEWQFEQIIVPASATVTGKETQYFRDPGPGFVYRTRGTEQTVLSRPAPPEFTAVTKDGQKIAFKRETDSRDRTRYVNDDPGLVMTEDEFGRITPSGVGQFFLNVLGLLMTWAVWFVAVWLLLLFQWPHALGISIPSTFIWAFALNFVSRTVLP